MLGNKYGLGNENLLGYHHTIEAKIKIGLSKIGKPGCWLGIKRSEETKTKMRLAHRARRNRKYAIIEFA